MSLYGLRWHLLNIHKFVGTSFSEESLHGMPEEEVIRMLEQMHDDDHNATVLNKLPFSVQEHILGKDHE